MKAVVILIALVSCIVVQGVELIKGWDTSNQGLGALKAPGAVLNNAADADGKATPTLRPCQIANGCMGLNTCKGPNKCVDPSDPSTEFDTMQCAVYAADCYSKEIECGFVCS